MARARPSATSSVVRLDISSTPAHQDHVVEPRRDGEDPLPKGQGARCAGPFGSGGGLGRQADQVGDDGPPVGLVDEKVVGEIPQIEGIDVLGIHALVHRGDHFPEGLGKQVFGILVLEHAELRHAGTDDGDAPAEFSAFFHLFSPG